MQLNATIARQIVERTMKIIKYSVNVMDEQGRIIGSGDTSRLNQRHEGAILALNDHRIVEIDDATSKQLKGVKPGINFPIIFQHKAIGVVGISGEPDLVRNYGELVKMTAELIVEQAALMAQVQWNKRHREELVLQLIEEGSELNENQLLSIAERLGLDLAQPRIAAIVKVYPVKGKSLSLDHLQRLVHLLEYPERDNLVGIASVSMNEVVVLKPITLSDNGWSRALEQKRVNQLMKRVTKEGDFTIRIALGDYFPSLQGLSQSFMTAKATMEASNTINSQQDNVLFYQDHILPVLLNGLKDDTWRQEQLLMPLVKLQQNDPRGVLIKTLKAFFVQNCDLAQTCEMLHIHRNTLRYRLEKIEQETSLSFNNISDKTRLYLSLLSQP
ncbi:sugar diacid recognition domain-containing protein [Photobacterium profundum]|uniref:Sugar diacid utilization regulator n=1 Tax=Photobacterium profundum (strain SS9) TaxID=298386 RepID=Q6LMI3_PHOPR|nr:sugar diacid recognition domain-containing protein [Photobacterium profundum]CAG21494.1 putative sugar diacid utilization regulator [Photobacterium profundum SS9]